MSEYFPKPKSLGANVPIELNFSNYATNSDLKNSARVYSSDFAKKADSQNFKSDIDKLGIDNVKKCTK